MEVEVRLPSSNGKRVFPSILRVHGLRERPKDVRILPHAILLHQTLTGEGHLRNMFFLHKSLNYRLGEAAKCPHLL